MFQRGIGLTPNYCLIAHHVTSATSRTVDWIYHTWPETLGSAMFTFAMITGVKNGWLDATMYGPTARRAWIAAVGYIDENNDMTNVCEGTNKFNDLNYYLARRRRTGDFHGQAPVLWAASALLR